jgi:hypothetical protein
VTDSEGRSRYQREATKVTANYCGKHTMPPRTQVQHRTRCGKSLFMSGVNIPLSRSNLPR